MSKRKAKRTPTGDCFEANCLAFLDLSLVDPDVRLVHAEVMGQGSLEGTRFGHAFVEAHGQVYDNTNGRGVQMGAELYRLIGGIDQIGNEVRYTRAEVMARLEEHQHYGPWEFKSSTGL